MIDVRREMKHDTTPQRRRLTMLKSERSSWDGQAWELRKFFQPNLGRQTPSQTNKGHRKFGSIIDNAGSRARRVLTSGMLANASSPGRPWFELLASNPELRGDHEVTMWLNEATKRMRYAFNRSNTYRGFHQLYDEQGLFGTGGSLMLPNRERIVHQFPMTWGDYYLSQDAYGRVNTCYRRFNMTVDQLIREFGEENVSSTVKGMKDTPDAWITVIHCIEPRMDYNPELPDDLNMPFRSLYFEEGADTHLVLRESGFKKFPVLAPRWYLTPGDIYGHSPAMEALGDVKQLQHEQLRKAESIDFQTRPAMQAPTSLKNRESEMVPGGISYHDAMGPNAGIRPAWQVNHDLSHLTADIYDVRSRIDASFYVDMFLMMQSTSQDTRRTAREIVERHEEKLLMLGPVLERQQNELLEPAVDLMFDAMLEAGAFPPIPPQLAGATIEVEFVSVLAQAQRQVGLGTIDRWTGNIMALSQTMPEVRDRFDIDGYADETAEMLGVPARLLVPLERAQELRQARNAAMAEKEQAELARQQGQAAQAYAGAAATAVETQRGY